MTKTEYRSEYMTIPAEFADSGFDLSRLKAGRHRYLCPMCSHLRQPGNQREKCLTVWLEPDRIGWDCNNCPWEGPKGSVGGPAVAATHKPREEAPARFIDRRLMDSYVGLRQRRPTALCEWLEDVFGWCVAQAALDLYNVGRSKEGHPVFWMVDCHGRVRQPKVRAYGKDGNSAAKPFVPKGFATTDGCQPCLYGEHLFATKPKDAPIVPVEGEKTAIVGECFFPEALWLSIGGADNWRRLVQHPLVKGRLVLVFGDPDKKGREMEASVRKGLDSVAACVQGFDTWPGEEKEVTGGYNLADFVNNPEGGEFVVECDPALRTPVLGTPQLFSVAERLQNKIAEFRENWR